MLARPRERACVYLSLLLIFFLKAEKFSVKRASLFLSMSHHSIDLLLSLTPFGEGIFTPFTSRFSRLFFRMASELTPTIESFDLRW
jgi:hypothetical protein